MVERSDREHYEEVAGWVADDQTEIKQIDKDEANALVRLFNRVSDRMLSGGPGSRQELEGRIARNKELMQEIIDSNQEEAEKINALYDLLKETDPEGYKLFKLEVEEMGREKPDANPKHIAKLTKENKAEARAKQRDETHNHDDDWSPTSSFGGGMGF